MDKDLSPIHFKWNGKRLFNGLGCIRNNNSNDYFDKSIY